ncbi:MAG: methyltransferase domain-containing protein [Acidobacteria bacterium]|nr:methyltransferase domain-containing protein [Acidobacteriota bacterium]MDW7984147.1 methyltransferase domain-containing protein [Acidobacteriota bacterium]
MALRPRTLGPVRNLEQHVRPDWWRRIFNSIYLKTDADVIDDPAITVQEVDFIIRQLRLQPDDRILDLCCGQGRHSLELARRGFRSIDSLDRSHYLIQRAKVAARKEGLPVRFREGDARKLPYGPDTFDVVLLLGNSFGYFESLQDDLQVLREIRRVLKPWGRVLIDVADGDYLRRSFEPRSWEWIDRNYFVCRERSLSSDGERLITREVVTHVRKGVIVDQFYAERLYNPERLQALLTDAGFSDIEFPGTLTPESQRNQDLGMMTRRIIVTAVVKKAWSNVRPKPQSAIRSVAVVLGDPRKPDPLKPGHRFDEDDLYTIDQLKDALRDLPGYRFVYLDDHDRLIEHLTRLKGKIDFVFNLCDEGFGNEPQRELHVPALLEILGIPYTGAGPQCLAYCYDKSLVRGIAKEMGIPVPEAIFIRPEDTTFELPMSFPVIVKPNFGDSSFGITVRSVCSTIEELSAAIEEIRTKFGYEKPILVEEFLTGKDLTVGIIGNPPDDYVVLPIAEEDYSVLPPGLPPICGYEAKWLPDSPYWNLRSIPADLADDTEKAIIEDCLQLFQRLGCRDYARFDWRLDAEGRPKLLEVNPNPGWCWDGHLAKMAALQGMNYAEMLLAILQAAERRLGLRPTVEATEAAVSIRSDASVAIRR